MDLSAWFDCEKRSDVIVTFVAEVTASSSLEQHEGKDLPSLHGTEVDLAFISNGSYQTYAVVHEVCHA